MESNVVLMIVFRYIFQSPHRKWSTLKPSPRRGYTREHPKVVWCVWQCEALTQRCMRRNIAALTTRLPHKFLLVPRPLFKAPTRLAKSPKTEAKLAEPGKTQLELSWGGQTEVAQKRSREIRHSEHMIDGLSPRHKSMAGLIKSIRGFRDPMYH
jgi:hypothetical protein